MEPLPVREKMLGRLNPGTTPKKPSLNARIVAVFFRLLVLLFKVCFGWLGWILDRYYERRLAGEVRRELDFLFEDYEARFVTSKRAKYATTVIVEFGVVRLRIGRHHDETAFSVASVLEPERWEPFQLIAGGITQWGPRPARTYAATELITFAPILKESFAFLQNDLSKENVHDTLSKAIQAESASVDAYAERLRSNGIEPVLYEEPVTTSANPGRR